MELGADGSLYVLEWGLRADGQNDSGLYRVDFRP